MRWTSEDEPSVAIVSDLRLAAGEQARAVGARQDADLDRDLAELRQAAAVHADALVEGELAGGLLVDEVEQALADARLAAGGLERGPSLSPPVRLARIESAMPSWRASMRPGRSLPNQISRFGGRLGVGQRAMRLGELDAEEVRQRRRACSSRGPGSPRGRWSGCRGSGPARSGSRRRAPPR